MASTGATSADGVRDGPVVWITGGASGLGRGLANALAMEGWRVAICDIDKAALANAAQEFAACGETYSVYADIAVAADVDHALAEIVEALGALDALVNNAFWVSRGSVLDMAEADFRRSVDVNLTGYFLCSRAVGRHMRDRGKGAIVNLSSGTAERAIPGTVAYATPKGGVNALTRAFATELAPFGVRVNTLTLGPIAGMPRIGTDDQGMDARRRRIPMGRRGTVEECLGALRYLISPESTWTTGALLHVDGGANNAALVQEVERYRRSDW